jgi:hypothetical protein
MQSFTHRRLPKMKQLETKRVLQPAPFTVFGGSLPIQEVLAVLAVGVSWCALSANAESQHRSRDIKDPAWSWRGDWKENRGAKSTATSGSEVRLKSVANHSQQ